MDVIDAPKGWSADQNELEDLAELDFPGGEFGLPGPYKALLFEGEHADTSIIIQCGKAPTEDPTDQVCVVSHEVTAHVYRIDEPKLFHDILATMHQAVSKGQNPHPNISCKTTLLDPIEGGYDYPVYLEEPEGWILERDTVALPLGLDVDLYGLSPFKSASLHDIEGNVFVFECNRNWGPGLGTMYCFLRWNKRMDLLQEFDYPSNLHDACHYMNKEQRQHGKIIWGKEFAFRTLRLAGERLTV